MASEAEEARFIWLISSALIKGHLVTSDPTSEAIRGQKWQKPCFLPWPEPDPSPKMQSPSPPEKTFKIGPRPDPSPSPKTKSPSPPEPEES